MRALKWLALSIFVVFAVAQFIPYGRMHDNPTVVSEPAWPDPAARALAQRACYDCHSNETRWPWYSYLAPASWLVEYDVKQGREHLNFSEWSIGGGDGEEAAEEVLEGEMPPAMYVRLHREAALTPAERRQLATALSSWAGGAEGHEALDVD